ncbi:MAG TPA: hypothetical protein VD770_01925, partial [Coxiellaceae bacterium]|nr:hypothetical protein [Coxiellaceae bacterium]
MIYIKRIFILILTLTVGSFMVFQQGLGLNTAKAYTAPQLPNEYINTDLSQTPVTGKSIIAQTTAEFKQALKDAVGGDEIVLTAGQTYVGPFELPNKAGNSWITIRTSKINELPAAGVRVGPSHSSLMAKIVSPGLNQPALTTANTAHHFRIIGIEFSKSKPSDVVTNLIYLEGNQTQHAQMPHHIILDRIYAHGDASSNLRRCIALNTAYTAVIDSHVSDCHEIGADAQAIAGWNGTGPFK